MSTDLDKFNEEYKKFYTSMRKEKLKPVFHINTVSTYFFEVSDYEMDLFNLLSKGMSGSELFHYMEFIEDNIPTGNLKVVVSFNGQIRGLFISIGENNVIYVRGTDEKFKEINSDGVAKALSIAVAYSLCQTLSEENTYLGVQTISCKSKRSGKDYPLDVTYVSKHKKPLLKSPISSNEIDWKHSWAVAGHWRKTRAIGKNRYGERVVLGKTWVIPSIKGKGEFVKKIRIIGGKND